MADYPIDISSRFLSRRRCRRGWERSSGSRERPKTASFSSGTGDRDDIFQFVSITLRINRFRPDALRFFFPRRPHFPREEKTTTKLIARNLSSKGYPVIPTRAPYYLGERTFSIPRQDRVSSIRVISERYGPVPSEEVHLYSFAGFGERCASPNPRSVRSFSRKR